MNLETGKVYFDVGYSENELIIPIIDTFVYIGKNLLNSEEDKEDYYYFQDSDCYVKHGSFTEITDEKIKRKLEITRMEEGLAEMLLTIESLQELLHSKQLQYKNYFGGL